MDLAKFHHSFKGASWGRLYMFFLARDKKSLIGLMRARYMLLNQFVLKCSCWKLLWAVFNWSRRILLINLETSVEGHSVSPGGERGLVTGIFFANRKAENTKVWKNSINSHSCTWRQVWCNEIQQNHLGWKIVFHPSIEFSKKYDAKLKSWKFWF